MTLEDFNSISVGSTKSSPLLDSFLSGDIYKTKVLKPSVKKDMLLGTKDKIIDADTIEKNGIRYRISDINAPEVNHAGVSTAVDDYTGKQSAKWLRDRIENGVINRKQLQIADSASKDKYGRTLGSIINPDGTSVSDEMTSEGYANAFVTPEAFQRKSYTPEDTRKLEMERQAFLNRRGNWKDAPDTMMARTAMTRKQQFGRGREAIVDLLGDNPLAHSVAAAGEGFYKVIGDTAGFLGADNISRNAEDEALSYHGSSKSYDITKKNLAQDNYKKMFTSNIGNTISSIPELTSNSLAYMMPSMVAAEAISLATVPLLLGKTATAAVPAIARLSSGKFGTIAKTLLPETQAGLLKGSTAVAINAMPRDYEMANERNIADGGKHHDVSALDRLAMAPSALLHSGLDVASLGAVTAARPMLTTAKNIIESGATEFATEGLQGVIEDVSTKIGTNNQDKIDLYHSFMSNAVGGGLVGGAMGGMKESSTSGTKKEYENVEGVDSTPVDSTTEAKDSGVKNAFYYASSIPETLTEEEKLSHSSKLQGEVEIADAEIASKISDINKMKTKDEKVSAYISAVNEIESHFNSVMKESGLDKDSKRAKTLTSIKNVLEKELKDNVILSNFKTDIENEVKNKKSKKKPKLNTTIEDEDVFSSTQQNYDRKGDEASKLDESFMGTQLELDSNKYTDIATEIDSLVQNYSADSSVLAEPKLSASLLGQVYNAIGKDGIFTSKNGLMMLSSKGIEYVRKNKPDGISASDYMADVSKYAVGTIDAINAKYDNVVEDMKGFMNQSNQADKAKSINSAYVKLFGVSPKSEQLGSILSRFKDNVHEARKALFNFYNLSNMQIGQLKKAIATKSDVESMARSIATSIREAHPELSNNAVAQAVFHVTKNTIKSMGKDYSSLKVSDVLPSLKLDKSNVVKKERPVSEKKEKPAKVEPTAEEIAAEEAIENELHNQRELAKVKLAQRKSQAKTAEKLDQEFTQDVIVKNIIDSSSVFGLKSQSTFELFFTQLFDENSNLLDLIKKVTFDSVSDKNIGEFLLASQYELSSSDKYKNNKESKVYMSIMDIIDNKLNDSIFSNIDSSSVKEILFNFIDSRQSYSKEDRVSNSSKEIVATYYKNTIAKLVKLGVDAKIANFMINLISYRYGMDKNGKYSQNIFAQKIINGEVLDIELSTNPDGSSHVEIDTTKNKSTIYLSGIKSFHKITNSAMEKLKGTSLSSISFMHEMAHVIETTMTSKERKLFNAIYNQDTTGLSSEQQSEMFAMGLTNMLLNPTPKIETTAMENNILKSTFQKVKDFLSGFIDSALKMLGSKNKVRGEINDKMKKFNESTKEVESLFAMILGSQTEDLSSLIKSAKSNPSIAEFLNVKNFEEMYNVKAYKEASKKYALQSEVGGKVKAFNEYYELRKKLSQANKNLDGIKYLYNFKNAGTVSGWIITKVMNSKPIASLKTKIAEHGIFDTGVIAKLKAENMSIHDYFYKDIDTILSKVQKAFKQTPEKQAAAVHRAMVEATKHMSDVEKDSFTRSFVYTGLYKLTPEEISEAIMQASNDTFFSTKITELFKTVSIENQKAIANLASFMVTNKVPEGGLATGNTQAMSDTFNIDINDLNKMLAYSAMLNTTTEDRLNITKSFQSNIENSMSAIGIVKTVMDATDLAYKNNGEEHLSVAGQIKPMNNKPYAYQLFDKMEDVEIELSKDKENKLISTFKVDGGEIYLVGKRSFAPALKDGFVVNSEGKISGIEIDDKKIKLDVSDITVPTYKKDSNGDWVQTGQQTFAIPYETQRANDGLVENIADVMKHQMESAMKYGVRKEMNELTKELFVKDITTISKDTPKDELPLMVSFDELIKLNEALGATPKKRSVNDNPFNTMVKLLGKDIASLYKPIPSNVPMPIELSNVMLVRQDVSDMVVGFRETMIGGGKNHLLRISEVFWKDAVKHFKANVIAKSISAIQHNIIFNFGVMLAYSNVLDTKHPLNFAKAIKYVGSAAIELKKFSKHSKIVVELELKKEYLSKINKSLSKEESDKLKESSRIVNGSQISMFADEGFLQSIHDGIKYESYIGTSPITDLASSGVDVVASTLNRVIGKKLFDGKGVKSLARNLYLSEGTYIGDTMSGLLRNSDYVFRIALYNSLSSQGMSHNEAKAISMEMFVDYRKNASQELTAISEYGVAPFAVWVSRMQFALGRTLTKKPLMLLALIMSMMDGDDEQEEVMEQMGIHKGHDAAWYLNIMNSSILSDMNFFGSSPSSSWFKPSIYNTIL
jgi:endonuclease YncB( thermonuclease family)